MTTTTAEPVGTINVFDPHPLNWLFVTWNTMEELVRTDHDGFHRDGAGFRGHVAR